MNRVTISQKRNKIEYNNLNMSKYEMEAVQNGLGMPLKKKQVRGDELMNMTRRQEGMTGSGPLYPIIGFGKIL